MTAIWLPEDEPFFREWNHRLPDDRRSLTRAQSLAELLGIHFNRTPPTIAVVGSKGKGTAAAAASSILDRMGLTVGTVLSPPFRTNRERIRLGGRALSDDEYRELSGRLSHALAKLGPPTRGYLAPTGAYTVSGAAYLIDHGADALVLEEGLGGRSDEVSLFPPDVVVVTPVFAEHLGLLGPDVPHVAADLVGVATERTHSIWTLTQSEEVLHELEHQASRVEAQLEVVPTDDWSMASARTIPGFGRANAALGGRAAQSLFPDQQLSHREFSDALRRLQLPGRLSVHRRGEATWVVDAAISPSGVAEALSWCLTHAGRPEAVLASFPDVKDAQGCFDVLAGYRVLPVTAGETYLTFAPTPTGPWRPFETAISEIDEAQPAVVLAIGTISFIGEALNFLEAQTERLWT